jgi:hypothetical protein
MKKNRSKDEFIFNCLYELVERSKRQELLLGVILMKWSELVIILLAIKSAVVDLLTKTNKIGTEIDSLKNLVENPDLNVPQEVIDAVLGIKATVDEVTVASQAVDDKIADLPTEETPPPVVDATEGETIVDPNVDQTETVDESTNTSEQANDSAQ